MIKIIKEYKEIEFESHSDLVAKALLRNPSAEFLMMIKEFNPVLLQQGDMYEAWLRICCEFAKENGVPLREWIEEKPLLK